ncbi:MAG: 1,4-alpha-glucan branching protein GlgB [Deltaproteobacteria bacterium]|nr:1,4-alpha-glucan branching protein GlgB [Deltaproteobacteria bacterium]
MSRSESQEAGRLTEDDLYLLGEGNHHRLYRRLGAHPLGGGKGTRFAVWAPDAEYVSVVGDFNGWDADATPLSPRGQSGCWEGTVLGVASGALYKYHLRSRHGGEVREKADPLAFYCEEPPRSASVVWDLDGYAWRDGAYLARRAAKNTLDAPISIYEMHLGSWMRAEDGSWLSYRELAPRLIEHLGRTSFTHVELLPVMEHPYYGSWGYQVTGYFAASARYGTPQDLMFLIDELHQAGYGVILDWVPAHFPNDEHALARFDGTHLYEHADPRLGYHPDWDTLIFNYGRNEVKSFLLSSALFWLDRFHADGLRVDAVASMLYLDYSRKEGEWIPNAHGGRENLEALSFLRRMNEVIFSEHPGVQTWAEESTAWPGVSRPTYLGGVGFGFKWDMGWMHDTLKYFREDPIHRRWHHHQLTFRGLYAFSENFALPLSHDEVVHGKGSLLGKMPGDAWQKRANLRLLFANQWGQPGKKLLFMGGELGQPREWDHEGQLQWELLDDPDHAGLVRLVGDLNTLYREQPAMHRHDCDARGFTWIEAGDADQSVYAWMRHGDEGDPTVLVVLNATPMIREGYRLGVPEAGRWREALNTDAPIYGGSGVGNLGGVEATAMEHHGWPASLTLSLPPLGALFLVHE